jgi:hypothetical protein
LIEDTKEGVKEENDEITEAQKVRPSTQLHWSCSNYEDTLYLRQDLASTINSRRIIFRRDALVPASLNTPARGAPESRENTTIVVVKRVRKLIPQSRT